MRIGDRVRLLRGTEEGRIVAIKGKIVDVEIDDGFVIPTMQNEIVLIDKKEAQTFQREEPIHIKNEVTKNDDFIADGIYLGLDAVQESFFEAFLINQTNHTLLYSISQYDKKIINGIAHGVCEPYKKISIGELTSSIFNDSKRLLIQIAIHEIQSRLKKQPINIELEIKKEQLDKSVFLFSLDKHLSLINLENPQTLHFDPVALGEKMMGNSPIQEKKKDEKKTQKELTVDLHIEKLSVELKSNEILAYQLSEFEKAFDKALQLNVEKLKIIHGLGAGILRNEIHKRLSVKKEVKYYEDADKEKFGFGSTIIYF